MENNLTSRFYNSRPLAERYAKRTNSRIVARRNSKGRFSKRGHWFTFELKPKELLRYTVGITFPYRKDYGSVLAQLYTSKWKKRSKSERAKKDKGAALEAAIVGVEAATKYPRAKFWFNLESVTAIETATVPYDESFAERIVVVTEIEDDTKEKVYRRK